MVEKITSVKLKILKLYLSNYTAQYHVRELAKLAKKNHVTLLPHLYDLDKDKILISKKIGKNKTYSLNFDNILTLKYIVMAEITESIEFLEHVFLIKKIASEIFHIGFEGAILLFGSYAKKTQTNESDIDLFYLGNIKQTDIDAIRRIGSTYGKTINVKSASLNNFELALQKKDILVREIIKNHVILQNGERFVNALWRHYVEIS